jgi:hypothetical protein
MLGVDIACVLPAANMKKESSQVHQDMVHNKEIKNDVGLPYAQAITKES